jgi:hypothetical protein
VRGFLRGPTEWCSILAAIRLDRYDQDSLTAILTEIELEARAKPLRQRPDDFQATARPDVSRRSRPVVGYPALHECAGPPTFHFDRAALPVKGVAHRAGDKFGNNHAIIRNARTSGTATH